MKKVYLISLFILLIAGCKQENINMSILFEPHQSASQRLNDGLSDIYYFLAMSLKKLGDDEEANIILGNLVALGQERLGGSDLDFFAKFGEKETADDKAADAWYLIGLGYNGLGDHEKSREAFKMAVGLNLNHDWAKAKLNSQINF